jgi:hypothetical protein
MTLRLFLATPRTPRDSARTMRAHHGATLEAGELYRGVPRGESARREAPRGESAARGEAA